MASMEFREKSAYSTHAQTGDRRRYAGSVVDVVAGRTARRANYLATRLCIGVDRGEGCSHPCAGSSIRQMVRSIHACVGSHLGGYPVARAYQRFSGARVIDRRLEEFYQFLKCFQLSVWIAACKMPRRSRSLNGVVDADVVKVRGMSADLSPASTMTTGAPEKRVLSRSASDLSSSSMESVSCMDGLSMLMRTNAARGITERIPDRFGA